MYQLNLDDLDQLVEKIADKVVEKIHERSQRRFVSREEFAKSRGLGMRTVDRAIAEGKLEVERVGRRVMIPANAQISQSNFVK
jgi:hypothetical protein